MRERLQAANRDAVSDTLISISVDFFSYFSTTIVMFPKKTFSTSFKVPCDTTL